ncbi:MAG: indolepyruvate ferredoxin oxidoreductase family protein [Burkholderiales bacterium]|nr:indolepyruvate ferredoxin oxidoreductase family protein [Burkholderiales bacterium]
MNAPLPPSVSHDASVQSALERVSLDDKYALEYGHAFMSGVQALVKLPMLQQVRDLALGKRTAGFISGYRGSPLGTYDLSLVKAEKYLKAHHIVFQPGVNEELAATALWGTQQLGFAPPGSNQFDGVFGIWYGKGPGVDRCADVFKHANMAGTTAWGGVIAVAGDDHIAKSSTAAHQSDHIFKACGLPVFFPATVQEILDLGLHAFAMSRYAGVWAGMKTIQEIVESSATVMIDPNRVQIVTPTDFAMPPGGLHIRWPDAALEQEARLFDFKWYAALAYIRANRLNYNVIEGENGGKGDRFGIIASGKAFNDTRQALHDLGLDDATCRRIGLRLHKVGVVWPLEAQLTREFASGLQEILVVEEKRQVIEYQLKEELYNWRADVRPNVLGKFSEGDGDFSGGEWSLPNPSASTLLRANADLSPAIIARAIAQRLRKLGLDADTQARIDAHLGILAAKERSMQVAAGADPAKAKGFERQPWFCAGCPHNTSTRVPEGSRAMAGIGCHFMTIWMDRATVGFTQMGGEGVPWVEQQPFSNEQHMFANLGDGTYFHSGLLAVRQSIAAGVNITYKILYNDAVAMTGGQQVGERPGETGTPWQASHSVVQIAQSMRAEGAIKIVVVTDEPEKYAGINGLPDGIAIEHRDELDRIQREFRLIKGTTVIIYDQTCATEKRRRRKHGTLVDPAKRVFINELVCEGCGDCGEQSNCISIEPLETPFGRKRQINQSTCNKDFSCVKGFCPSFVTVEGGQLRKAAKGASPQTLPPDNVPLPQLPNLDRGEAWGIVVAGVGGTGVITIGQLLGVAAHLEGKGIVTQDAGGLAQKGGATWSHVFIAQAQDHIRTTRVSMAGADLIIGCDPIVVAGKETVSRMREGRTHVALNSHSAPTATFVHQADWENPAQACQAEIARAVGEQGFAVCDADAIATQLLGDSIYTNPIMLGFAWQKGWIPLQLASLTRAMELNGVAVQRNLAAFAWGRLAAHDPAGMQRALHPGQVVAFTPTQAESLDDMVRRRVEFLTGYQNAAYARRYADVVAQVRSAESALFVATPQSDRGAAASLANTLPLTQAVARYLFKLMAYKDEYEVARLHTDADFLARVRNQFEGDIRLHYQLASPLLATPNAAGKLKKRAFGPWVQTAFRLLAPLKVLRGGPLDVFGYSAERRQERALVQEYSQSIVAMLPQLNVANRDAAVAFARVPEHIRGFGHVKARHLAAARSQWALLKDQYYQVTP